MLMSRKDRIVESLTSQLCVHEKVLLNRHDEESRVEAFTVKTSRKKN